MAIRYIDLDNGSDSNDGTTWALATKTITGMSGKATAGDEVRMSKTPDPDSIGNATWTNGSQTVTLATAQNVTVDLCESAWTAANSATVALTGVATDAKQGSYCMQITAPASPATNTKYAYFPITSINLSSYQKLSFWLKNEVAVSAGNWKICLCSDTAGNTIVDTFEIPAIPSNSYWLPLTIARTGGGNLGSAIQSIALYSSTAAPTASKYVRLDDIISCTTNGLNLQSVISKNGNARGGDEPYFCMKSIVGTTIILDNDVSCKSNEGNNYAGTTETVTTYKRETFKTVLASSISTQINSIGNNGSGTAGYLSFTTGWEVGTENQSGETYLDGLNGMGYGIYASSKQLVKFDVINIFRYYYGVNLLSARNFLFEKIQNTNNMTQGGVCFSYSYNNVINYINSCFNGMYSFNIGYSIRNVIKNARLWSNSTQAVFYQYANDNYIINLNTSRNSIVFPYTPGINYVENFVSTDDTALFGSATGYIDGGIYFKNYGGIEGDNRIYLDNGTIQWQTSVKYGTAPGAWKMLTDNVYRGQYFPLKLKVAEIACMANTPVTVSIWGMKEAASEMGLRLVVYADSNLGITEVSDTKTDDTSWEQLSIQFTPTRNCVVPIYVEAWYITANSSVYVGPINVS